MERDTEIPGLVAITDEQGEDGRVRFIFEIEDDKVPQFFEAFGLMPGDIEGFRRVLVEAIELMINRGGGERA
jgi:hypothetical protein